MIDEQANPFLMQPRIATEGQGFTNEAAPALAERVMEALNMIGLTAPFRNGPVPLGGQDGRVGVLVIGLHDGSTAIVGR